MIAILDCAYGQDHASAACVVAREWAADSAAMESAMRGAAAAAYTPGQFYKRELPLLLGMLQTVSEPLSCIVIDGYVWLDAENAPGLGAHLREALGGAIPIIGVAKTAYAGNDAAIHVLRGKSTRPLYVTAAGIDALIAAQNIRAMHGSGRIPFLLRRADALARASLLTPPSGTPG